jgi:hypothetical protein
MHKYKVFISSVQSEFSKERQLVFDFIHNDELMGQYFEPFIFEQIVAQDANPRQLYLDEASSCQVYLLLMGKKYGNVLPDGISPTEKEYQAAGESSVLGFSAQRKLSLSKITKLLRAVWLIKSARPPVG